MNQRKMNKIAAWIRRAERATAKTDNTTTEGQSFKQCRMALGTANTAECQFYDLDFGGVPQSVRSDAEHAFRELRAAIGRS